MSGYYLQVGLVLATHPKARKAGRAAMGFWLEGLLHSQIQEADGFVDDSFLDGGWGTKREAVKLAQILCDVGLWSKVADGYQIAKFEKWNRLRTEIEDLRRRDRERKTNQKTTKREPKPNQIVTSLEPNMNQSETKREPNEICESNDSMDLAKISVRNPPLNTNTNTNTDPNTNKDDGFALSVSRVFDAWSQGWKALKGTNPTLTEKRRKAVVARLREGRSVDDLCLAATGVWKSSFNVDGGFVDLELVCRSDGHVERFIGFAKGTIQDNRKPAPIQTGMAPHVRESIDKAWRGEISDEY